MLEEPTSLRIDELGVPVLFTEAARFQSWLDVEAALAELIIIPAKMPDSSIHGILDRARSREVLRASVRPPPNRYAGVLDKLGLLCLYRFDGSLLQD